MRLDGVTKPRFILNFHGLGDTVRKLPASEMDCWLDSMVFEKILDDVRGRKDVQITFDDANESDFAIALPLLKARNLSAHFFVVSKRIGQKSFLSLEQLRSLHAEHMVIGNHGMCHRNWRLLGEAELHEELVEAKDALEQMIGVPVVEAACPYGAYDRRVLRKLWHLGYKAVYTSDGGPTFMDSWLRARNTVRRSHNPERTRRSMNEIPSGGRRLWRELKLLIKRWR